MNSAMLSDGDLRNLQDRRLQGRYRLTRVIDWGGFGAVYEAVDEKFDDRIVAVKVAAAAASERAFAKEAKLAHKFEHPNVVKVHDYGVDSGLSYIVMELLAGVRFDTLLEQYRGQLPHDMLCKFVREIGSALRKGHKNGLVHRDLKPKNVLLVEDGTGDEDHPRQRFVLLDFGIASQIDASNSLKNLTMDGAGTPEYMSPEQVQAQPVTACSDVYSFGVILYQLLTGHVPFPLPDQSHLAVAQCLTAIVRDPPPRFDQVAPDRLIDRRIEELVLQCLEKDPKKRPQSMQQVRERFLDIYAPGTGGNTVDSLDRGTLAPGFHQSGLSTENAAGAETRPSWHGRTIRNIRQPSRPWPMMSMAGGLLIAIAVAFFLWPRGGPTPGFSLSVVPQELSIEAGQSQDVVVTLSRVRYDESIDVTLEPRLEGVTIVPAVEDDTSDNRTYTVQVALNAPVAAGDLTVVARSSDQEQQASVPLAIRAVPNVWLPEGFEPSTPVRLKRIAGRVLYETIRREIPGEPPAEFVLVDEPGRLPFYMMKTKVWNGLFARFAQEHPDFHELRPPQSAGWRLEDVVRGTNDRLPATNMTVLEAWRFAAWLAPDHGDLPTASEWDTAAGYYLWLRAPDEAGSGPYRDPSQVAVGRKGPAPVDRPNAETSPHGCRDMAGNGFEWTRTGSSITIREGVPLDEALRDRTGFTTLVVYRGWSFESAEPLSFTELEKQNRDKEMPIPIGFSKPEIGFRVVIRIP